MNNGSDPCHICGKIDAFDYFKPCNIPLYYHIIRVQAQAQAQALLLVQAQDDVAVLEEVAFLLVVWIWLEEVQVQSFLGTLVFHPDLGESVALLPVNNEDL